MIRLFRGTYNSRMHTKSTCSQPQVCSKQTLFRDRTPTIIRLKEQVPLFPGDLDLQMPPLMQKLHSTLKGQRYFIQDPEDSREYGILCLLR